MARVRAMPGNRYGIDDANGMRLFTARLVEVGDRDDPRVRLDKIKLKANKDVLLGGQVVLAHDKSTLDVMKVVLDAQFNSLRSAFGLEGDAAYGVDPSIEVYFLPGHDEARKIGSSVDDGKSYCCSVVRGLLRLTAASENVSCAQISTSRSRSRRRPTASRRRRGRLPPARRRRLPPARRRRLPRRHQERAARPPPPPHLTLKLPSS